MCIYFQNQERYGDEFLSLLPYSRYTLLFYFTIIDWENQLVFRIQIYHLMMFKPE